MSALLQVEDLDLFYGDAQALAGVSLEIAERARSSPSSAPTARARAR